MPQFTYRARNAQGGLVEGVFDCAAREFAASGHDTGRRAVDFGETIKTAPRPTNDAHTPPGADRRSQFFAGPERHAANFPAAVCKPRRCGRGEWRVTANFAAFGETSDAGQGIARPRATGIDLSGLPRSGRRDSRHNFHYLHGAAVNRVHGANRWRASAANPHFATVSSCDHRVLVGRHTDTDWWNCWFPRHGSDSRGKAWMGPAPLVNPRIWPGDSSSLLCAVCSHPGDFDGKRRASVAFT